MKLIAHRGNLWGPNLNYENNPEYIDFAISQGFNVECDLRVIRDHLYLGHDECTWPIPVKWLFDKSSHLYIHCKNMEAISYLSKFNSMYHFFWHESDKLTLTSRGVVWVHPLTKDYLDCDHIRVSTDFSYTTEHTIGICTDYPMKMKKQLEEDLK